LKKVQLQQQSGIIIDICLKAIYLKQGKRSVKSYLDLISVINPIADITLIEPDGKIVHFERT